MKQYHELLQNILDNGREKESGRANMPNTIGLSHGTILMKDIYKNFPLLTTKKMFLKGIIEELLWFLRGETNIKPLVDKGVNIWNGDAYRWYLNTCNGGGAAKPDPIDDIISVIPIQYTTIESFIEAIKNNDISSTTERLYELYGYKLGDLGKVYGHQWRNQDGIDQIKDIYEDLQNNPYGRYKILDAWNKKDFSEMALPPCHLLYQFIVRPMTIDERLQYKENLHKGKNPGFELGKSEEYYKSYCDNWNIPKYFLDLNMYQRSCDVFLGVPFNLASMSLLLMIMAKAVGMVAGDAFWIGGDVHLYLNHIPMAKEQLSRKPLQLPRMTIKKEINLFKDILNLSIKDFKLIDYQSYPTIKAELFTGYKKL